MPRTLFLVGLGSLGLALLSFGLADRSVLPPEELAGHCGDWWCAPENSIPVGLSLGLGGIGVLALAAGFTRWEEPESQRDPRGRHRNGVAGGRLPRPRGGCE
jgi:hypothetical protein